ncbi:MAG: PD40 domain-containing protein [Acidobacteria bacterium]|nr:PD40 domain-containing protein [Acidobacteriota bacterium]
MLTLLLTAIQGFWLAGAGKPLLLQSPTINQTHIVFVHADDLWIVAREGGEARRFTTGIGSERDPIFSPDGSLVAFTGEYDGNTDVFVVPAQGGVPRRLTYHPGPDNAAGWTPDGKRVLFRSSRNSSPAGSRLFTIPVEGGFPSEVALPLAAEGAYSPDGSRLAYVPLMRAFQVWKRYRGGRTTPLWIATLADSRIEKVPRENSNDFNPMWIGNRVYFLSDRNGPVSLYAYDPASRKVTPALKNDGFEIKSASAASGAIVFEQFGEIHVFDLKTSKSRKIEISVAGDLPAVRPTQEKLASRIRSARLSPTGARALFEARGEIFTVPAEKGDVRNLTNTSGAAERNPAWSPDGRKVAYISDESGEYMLHIRGQDGLGEAEKFSLGDPPSYYFTLVWSPDSKKIAFTDKALRLASIDLEKKTVTEVDRDTYDGPQKTLDPAWSPDSRWIGYTRKLKSHLRAVFVHSLETGKNHQLTDGMSDARFADFDRDGKFLYFTASTDAGPTSGWLDMSMLPFRVTRSVYLIVLPKDTPSPLAPESDEEKPVAEPPKPDAKKPEKAEVKVAIDLENISQRILALPIPAREFSGLVAGKAGTVYLLETTPGASSGQFGGSSRSLHKYDLKTRKFDKILDGISEFALSHNGEKMLFRQGDRWAIQPAGSAPKPGEGSLKLEGMEARIDPQQEWRQIYREAWRIERDFFYDPGLHGVNWADARARYEKYLDGIASRSDLNYLMSEMFGEMSVGHLVVGGGAAPEPKRVQGGLLGADYRLENGRYRFARVYNGENWNPELRAPLTQPGVNVVAGEYLLAVNGREVRASDNIYSFFEATAGKSVLIKVGPDPGGNGAREVTVTPVPSETALRTLSWIEDNRRKVDQVSNGTLGYVYLPNTANQGYGNFNRYYFAQIGKAGVVIDERFNGGGMVANYIIDLMRRPLLNYWSTRDGEDFTSPQGGIFGPKVMLINEYAGSGGDWMPWYFRKAGLGPLIGKRTWGGLVGNIGSVPLIDGGFLSAPNLAFWNLNGQWEIENAGVPPDIEVDLDPQAWRAGKDTQLEKAVEVAMAELAKKPLPVHKKPAYPNYHRGAASGSSGR